MTFHLLSNKQYIYIYTCYIQAKCLYRNTMQMGQQYNCCCAAGMILKDITKSTSINSPEHIQAEIMLNHPTVRHPLNKSSSLNSLRNYNHKKILNTFLCRPQWITYWICILVEESLSSPLTDNFDVLAADKSNMWGCGGSETIFDHVGIWSEITVTSSKNQGGSNHRELDVCLFKSSFIPTTAPKHRIIVF